ncbi:hypothetical protein COO60DRAFT_221079 [Scenedesmus sp. NREL 46B-D3]|nr:hypothetical protein COO60DRAFT_221079 [Scenedesmus sp. NREL 46B-D3]
MLKHAPKLVSCRVGVLPLREDDQLRCLATASLLLQQSVTAWRAQQQIQQGSLDANQSQKGSESSAISLTSRAGVSSSAAAAADDNTKAAAGRRALLQSLEQEVEENPSNAGVKAAAAVLPATKAGAAPAAAPPASVAPLQGRSMGAASRQEGPTAPEATTQQQQQQQPVQGNPGQSWVRHRCVCSSGRKQTHWSEGKDSRSRPKNASTNAKQSWS